MQIWLKAHPEVLDHTDETINGSKIDKLTSRQKIIFQMMIDGSTNNEIAKAIGYSESLVKAESVVGGLLWCRFNMPFKIGSS
jgi:DNA-binding NarL/FixJ family response regulator